MEPEGSAILAGSHSPAAIDSRITFYGSPSTPLGTAVLECETWVSLPSQDGSCGSGCYKRIGCRNQNRGRRGKADLCVPGELHFSESNVK